MDLQKQVSKTSQAKVQEQIIEHLRRELYDLRLELDTERTRQKEAISQYERDLKTTQRNADAVARTQSHLEVRVEVSEREAREARSALQEARRAVKEAESDAMKTAKDAAWRLSQSDDKINRLENEKQMAKEEIEQLKSTLDSERSATAALIREHTIEVKNLREELRSKTFEANKELQERSMRELEESRAVRIEAEKVQKVMEQDFRAVLAEKEEELRQARADAKATQKALEEKIRDSIKESMTRSLAYTTSEADLVRSLKHELESLKIRNKKLERNLQAAGDAVVDATNKERLHGEELLAEQQREIRNEVRKLLQTLKSKDQIILKQAKQMDKTSHVLEKLKNRCSKLTDRVQSPNGDAKKKTKPQLPLKSAKVLERKTNALNLDNHSHVKDIVRQLQEKESEGRDKKRAPLQLRMPHHQNLDNMRSTNRTIEDLKAIDADIEKLRRQIESRDKVISRLREETRTKDEQLQMMIINRKQGIDENVAVGVMCTSPDASSESSGSDGTSPIPSDTISYLDFMNQKQKLVKNDNYVDENRNLNCTCQSLVHEVKALREREASLLAETAILREQNDLMEFRILELEECRPEDPVQTLWQARDNEDISDSGVMSLPTSEDLTSDSDQGDTSGHRPTVEIKLTGVATVFPSVQAILAKKSLECLQESGIFEDGDISQSGSTHSDCTALYRATETRASQTDVASSKTSELSAELWKLSEIQKRIQSEPKSPYAFCVTDYITFYEERLLQLQEKLSIYESRGDNRERLLNKRLEKEVALAYEIRGLKETITKLEERNLVLEEERCEFEEAENDSRLQCQRLELQLLELEETKVQLEMEINKLQRIAEDAKRMGGHADLADKVVKLQTKLDGMKNQAIFDGQRLKNLELQLEEKEAKMGALLELKLAVSATDAKAITEELGLNYRGSEKVDDGSTEKALRERIATLEATNFAFIRALSESDQIWATHEEEYKNRIVKLEKSYEEELGFADKDINELKGNVKQISAKLKIAETKLSKMEDIEETNSVLKKQMELLSADIISKDERIKILELDNAALMEKVKALSQEVENEKKMSDARVRVEVLQRGKDMEKKVKELSEQLQKRNKEFSDLEVTTSELKEEVETLETPQPKNVNEINFSFVVEPSMSKKYESGVQKLSVTPPDEAFKNNAQKIASLIDKLGDFLQVLKDPCPENPPEKLSDVEENTYKLSLKNQKLLGVLQSMKEDDKSREIEEKQLKRELDGSLHDREINSRHDSETDSKTTSDLTSNSSNHSTLQLALDNLQSKCRIKTGISKTLLELHENASSEDCSVHQSEEPHAFQFSIVKVEKINPSSLFVAWDSQNVPECAEGYSISVNRQKRLVIAGRDRNHANLSNLDLSKRCLIAVKPVSRSEIFRTTATAVFPPID